MKGHEKREQTFCEQTGFPKGRKNYINLTFLGWIFPRTSRPLRPDAWGSKSFSPPCPQESRVFGADVHDFRHGRARPEGFSKNSLQQKFALNFLAPILGSQQVREELKLNLLPSFPLKCGLLRFHLPKGLSHQKHYGY